MTKFLRLGVFAPFLLTLFLAGPAGAHPHVWVTVTSELLYGPDGAAAGVRHSWAFDDMYSAFATEGLTQKTKGVFTREELQGLAQVNITSLKDSDFFTFVKADSKNLAFGDATDYWLDYKNEILTLHFTLPFASPVKAKDLRIEIYDPTYFVDFELAKEKPVTLAGAPPQCKLAVELPREMTYAQGMQLSEADFNSSTWGSNFANKISVKCP